MDRPKKAAHATPSLRQEVLQRIRSAVISGEAQPGSMFSAPSLAGALGVSTTPVREALLELSRAGLLEAVRNRGFRVVEPSLRELEELFDMRDALEIHAARLLAARPGLDLSALRPLADAVAKAVEADDVQAYIESDRAFHYAFIAAAGNGLLTETVMNLRDKMRLYGISSRAGRERQVASVPEHYSMIQLAERGAADGLAKLLRHHVLSWKPLFVEALDKMPKMLREPIVVAT